MLSTGHTTFHFISILLTMSCGSRWTNNVSFMNTYWRCKNPPATILCGPLAHFPLATTCKMRIVKYWLWIVIDMNIFFGIQCFNFLIYNNSPCFWTLSLPQHFITTQVYAQLQHSIARHTSDWLPARHHSLLVCRGWWHDMNIFFDE